MYKGKRILAVIPARGGSKGLPGKNIKPINGKPLIGWTIETALNSKYLDKVILSTDSSEISDVAKSLNCEVPFMRPESLAVDSSTSIDVLLHAIDYLETNSDESFDIVMMLEPTSPLRETSDIDSSLEELIDNSSAESIAGVCLSESSHPDFLVELTENGFMRSKVDFVVKRRQDIKDLYFYEGTIYASYIEPLKKKKNFYHDNCIGYIVPKWKSFEIDDMSDFLIVENLLELREKNLLK